MKYWRVEPRAAACTGEWSALQVEECECSEQWQQPKFGLQEVVQKVCRQVVLVGGANLTVRTRRWAGCPYKTVGERSLVARAPNKFLEDWRVQG
jgi:hypothetical protein